MKDEDTNRKRTEVLTSTIDLLEDYKKIRPKNRWPMTHWQIERNIQEVGIIKRIEELIEE